jgi:CzcA family heavy metal efflux pump
MSQQAAIESGSRSARVGRFAIRHAKAITFIVIATCLLGMYCASTMPSSVFPQTDFPRVVILVENGAMPADEMMATITRPIEEAMKGIPGVVNIRSTTARGSADVNVFFTWKTDMVQSELYVLNRLAQAKANLPPTVSTTSYRLTFSAFPIVGVSVTGRGRSPTDLWEIAQYKIKPRFLRVGGVARVDLVGGRTPEFHVVADPLRLQAYGLSLAQVVDALNKGNLVAPAGMREQGHTLYLAVVDNRARGRQGIEEFAVGSAQGNPIRLRDVARVIDAQEPAFNVVTADGQPAVLLNVRSQPDGSTLDIAAHVKQEMNALRRELPPGVRLAFFYDQSLLVNDSVRSVWEAIAFGLLLSVVILYLFLKDWGATLVAIVVIPVTVLSTLVAMRLAGMTFNLMTLGGIAAAIGLVIDDAIVVVEAIHTAAASGLSKLEAIQSAVGGILLPLLGSTLTPVVVFLPLAFLDGVPGVFFRALALTMAVSLLTSLVLALTLTPSLAGWIIRPAAREPVASHEFDARAPVLARLSWLYERAARVALRNRWTTIGLCGLLLFLGAAIYPRLSSDFLPELDEGGFVIDYVAPPGTSLAETNRALLEVEKILKATPDVESYSRRTGAALGFHVVEPNTGDFLVKLRPDRKTPTQQVIAELREKFKASQPAIEWEFPGILGDLIGDLTSSPEPIEIKIFSTDVEFLKDTAPRVEEAIKSVPGIVDSKNGLVIAGPSISLRVRRADAQRLGLTADDIGSTVNTALLGQTASSVLEGDRVVNVRVTVDRARLREAAGLADLPLRTANGDAVRLSQVADIVQTPGELELRRDDLRQNVAVTARLENRDLGGAVDEIRGKLAKVLPLPPGTIEFGGLFQQQRESFHNLLLVLLTAVLLVFTVLLLEFRSFLQPMAIVSGAVLALLGTLGALWLTKASLNIISFLGAIIGVGIVAKNGILMLDLVEHFRDEGLTNDEALVRSGRRRLRPVLMTSLAAGLGMLPLAYGIGSGADMLKPMAIAIIGALCFSVLLSLIATPAIYSILASSPFSRRTSDRTDPDSAPRAVNEPGTKPVVSVTGDGGSQFVSR